MANETEIKVKVDVDLSGLEELSEVIESSTAATDEMVNNVNQSFNELSQSAEETAGNVDDVSESLNEVGDAANSIDSDGLDEIGDSAENSVGSNEQLNQTLQELSDTLKQVGDSASEEADKLNDSADAADNYSSLVGGITSLGLAAEFNNTANAADNYKVSMAALEMVAANNGVSMEAVSSAIKNVTDATSIGAGQARSFFSMMMNLGVTNTNALSESLINLKAQSAITGDSIEGMENKFIRLANSTSLSARPLTKLGLSLEAVAEANGTTVEELESSWKTMTVDQRIETLNNAMKENVGILDTLNATTSEQLKEVENSWGKLERTVGESTTVVSQAVLGLANGAIQGLSSAVENIPFAAEFAGGVLAVGSLVTAIKPATDTFNSLAMTVRNGIDILKSFGGAIRTITSAESIGAGIKALFTSATVAEEAATATGTAANTAAEASFLGLAVSEWLALAPVLLLVAAILILVGILLYLYFTNDEVRAAIDGFGQTLMTVGQIIVGSFISVLQQIVDWFNNILQTIQLVMTMGIMLITTFVQNAIIGFLNFITFIATLPARVAAYLTAIISRVASWASSMVSRAASTASQFVSRIVSGLASLPGRVYGELSKTLSRVIEWGSQIVSKFGEIAQRAWQAFLSGLGINSPGIIQKTTVKEMADTAKRIPESLPTAVHNMRVYAENMVKAYGQPTLPAPTMDGELPEIRGYGAGGETVDKRTINIEIGSVDNDDRVQEIVDAVRKALSWDNKTAGRVV